MSPPVVLDHTHQPLFRVIRAGFENALDTAPSKRAPNNRWNTNAFGALYSCCSTAVARAVARDTFRIGGFDISELQPEAVPQLAEIEWNGSVVDVITAAGLRANGLPENYPLTVSKEMTRKLASEWHAETTVQVDGVVCRSASLARHGFADWSGDHQRWSEVAIFVERADTTARLIARHSSTDWLEGGNL